jgi:hypothetical protein
MKMMTGKIYQTRKIRFFARSFDITKETALQLIQILRLKYEEEKNFHFSQPPRSRTFFAYAVGDTSLTLILTAS